MTRTLMAFSSGLDSTYLAWKILAFTNDELSLFWLDLSHIVYDSPEGPKPFFHGAPEVEKANCLRVLDWFRENLRPAANFEIVENMPYEREPADYPKGPGNGWIRLPTLKVAAARMKGFDRFVYGKTPEDQRTVGHGARWVWYQEWWAMNCPGTTLEAPLVEAWEGRPHALKYLPPELRAIVLTCDRGTKCGECSKCRMTTQAERMLADGVDPDAALLEILRTTKAGPYVDARHSSPPLPSYTK